MKIHGYNIKNPWVFRSSTGSSSRSFVLRCLFFILVVWVAEWKLNTW